MDEICKKINILRILVPNLFSSTGHSYKYHFKTTQTRERKYCTWAINIPLFQKSLRFVVSLAKYFPIPEK